MIKKIASFVILISLLSFTSSNNFRELVFEKLEDYTKNHPEKIYIQTDRPYYTTGDDIWYTAYLVNGFTHKKTNLSNVIKVELINEQDSILSKKRLYTEDVSVAGDFKIKEDWKPGNYLIRAYTNYMRNSDSDYFFQTQIPIWNVAENDSTVNSSAISPMASMSNDTLVVPPPDIGFYPEGGYLVNGLPSKVAIKVKNPEYENIKLEGFIKDSNDKKLMGFSIYKFGLGIIKLLPEANKTYYASINFNGEELKYPLPKALPNGYNLNIETSNNQIMVQANSNTAIGLKNSFLVVHQRGNLIYERLHNESTDAYSIKINTNTLSDGIVNFTLFDGEGHPACERLAYVNNPNNEVNINFSINNNKPLTREKVSVNLNLTDKNGEPLSGNLSLSVTDIDAVGHSTKNENIKTYLLLNSDLRGKIKDPGYFFEKENDSRRRYLLDLVMLTHGWRRFTWKDLIYKNNYKNPQYKIEKGIFISGHTKALKGEKQSISAATKLTFMGVPPYQEKKQSSTNGMFKFGPYVYHDTISAFIEGRVKGVNSDADLKNRFVSIYLNNRTAKSPKISHSVILKPQLQDTSKIKSFLKQAKNISHINSEFLKSARLLDEVLIIAKKASEEEKRNEELNARTDYGFPTDRLDMKDYQNQPNLTVLDLLRFLPGVNAINDTISIRGGGVPLILLDNFPVELPDISFMQVSQIEFIDVLKGADAAFYSNGGNGVIAIHSKFGVDLSTANIKRKPGIIDFKTIGFYTAREFYAPDHLNGFDEASKPDIRTTLHWEPKITLNESLKNAKISFFTSDVKSNYAIKIEGITNTGVPVYHLSTLEVD
jgi:hypothetical protein